MIPSELKRLLVSFKECDVRYLLADGFSYTPRHFLKISKNIDFWIKPSLDNSRRIIRALKIYGTPMHGITADKLASAETQFTLPCSSLLLEFYTYIPSLDFDACFEKRELHREGYLFIHLLNSTDLALARASLIRSPDDGDPDH